jgi:hypothetical protein
MSQVSQLWLECHELIFFFFKMFDTISDYNSATFFGLIGRMNSIVGYVILESNERFFSEMCF